MDAEDDTQQTAMAAELELQRARRQEQAAKDAKLHQTRAERDRMPRCGAKTDTKSDGVIDLTSECNSGASAPR